MSWGTTDEPTGHYLWQFYNTGNGMLDYSQQNSNYYVKNEFRPNPKIILYSLLEWNNLDYLERGKRTLAILQALE